MTPRCSIVVAALLALGCSETSTENQSTTRLLSVTPLDGTADVSTSPTIEVRFDGPVSLDASMLIALQVGDCPGPVVQGSWSRSADGMTLTFSPMSPLDPGARHTIHVGGGMRDGEGRLIDFETHGRSGTMRLRLRRTDGSDERGAVKGR